MSHFLQDMQVGHQIDLGHFTFTADHIKRFAALYDPQPFHMDEDAAKQSHFGALCASGWQTASIWMRLYVLHSQKVAGRLEQQGQPVAQMGPGLGRKICAGSSRSMPVIRCIISPPSPPSARPKGGRVGGL